MDNVAPVQPAAVPPIVLLVDDDRDTLDLYSTYFEDAGLWVASASSASDAVDAVAELKPDLVVADVGSSEAMTSTAVVDAVRQNPRTSTVPIILLAESTPEKLPRVTVTEADLVLIKPVRADSLLARVRELLTHSRMLRVRSDAARTKTAALIQKSAQLIERSAALPARNAPDRPCPSCGAALEWLECAVLDGLEYDYYRWCRNGCGLYSYQRSAMPGRHWIKLV